MIWFEAALQQIRISNADVVAFYRSLGFSVDDSLSMGKRLVED